MADVIDEKPPTYSEFEVGSNSADDDGPNDGEFEAKTGAEDNAVALDDLIFIGSYGKVMALRKLEPNSREPVWANNLPGCGTNHVVLLYDDDGQRLFVGTNGHVRCLDPQTGELVWDSSRSENKFNRSVTTLVLGSKATLIASTGDKVVALARDSGERLWWHKCKRFGELLSNLKVVGDLVLVCTAGSIYALNMADGEEVWKNTFSSRGYRITSLADFGADHEHLLIGGSEGFLWPMSAADGSDADRHSITGTGFKCVTVMAHPNNPGVFFAATSGQITVHAVDTLEQLAMNNLKGCGYSMAPSLAYWAGGIEYVAPPPYEVVADWDAKDVPETERLIDEAWGECVIVGINGNIVGLDPETLTVLFKTNLTGSYNGDFLSLLMVGDFLHIGSNGKYFVLDPSSGDILAREPLKGMSFSKITMATTLGSTDFHTSPLAGHKKAEEEQAAAASAGASG